MNSSIEQYVHDEVARQKLYKRTLWVVILSQVFGGAGLAAGITVGALIAQDMLGTDSFAGLPSALFTFGSAGAALLVGQLSQRYSRRLGLATGFWLGSLGAIGVIAATILTNIPLLFISLLVYGGGTATNLQARYAGTDLANAKQRATAISMAMVSTTFGAVAGPNLVQVMGNVADSIGIPTLAGPFILAAVAYGLAGLILAVMLRPDPYLVAKAIIANEEKANEAAQIVAKATNREGVMLGATIMIVSQVVMVAIMTMTPIHMSHHGHDLQQIGLVIGIHVGAMYLPSLITGVLVDKIGRYAMAIAAVITLIAAGVMAAVAPVQSMFWLTLALALLGIGWNFGFISGTALLTDAIHPLERAKIQGRIDVFVALSGAAGGMLSGVIVAGTSYATLSYVGALIALATFGFILYRKKGFN